MDWWWIKWISDGLLWIMVKQLGWVFKAELCRQRDATKAWRSCAAEGSCSIAQQRQQARFVQISRGKTWEKPGENQNWCGYLICYLRLFGKKSGFGNVNGYEEYATWFNEFNVVRFPFWWEHEFKKRRSAEHELVCRVSKICHWKVIQQTSKRSRKGFAQKHVLPFIFGIWPPHRNRAGLERWVISKTGGFDLE